MPSVVDEPRGPRREASSLQTVRSGASSSRSSASPSSSPSKQKDSRASAVGQTDRSRVAATSPLSDTNGPSVARRTEPPPLPAQPSSSKAASERAQRQTPPVTRARPSAKEGPSRSQEALYSHIDERLEQLGISQLRQQCQTLPISIRYSRDGTTSFGDMVCELTNQLAACASKASASSNNREQAEYNRTKCALDSVLNLEEQVGRSIDRRPGASSAASLRILAAEVNPARLARVTSDLLTSGKATLDVPGGDPIVLEVPRSIRDSELSSADRKMHVEVLLQRALLAEAAKNAPPNCRGVALDAAVRLASALTGKEHLGFRRDPDAKQSRETAVIKENLRALSESSEPTHATLNWNGSPRSVLITEVKDGFVYFHNPCGSQAVTFRDCLRRPWRQVVDEEKALEKMPLSRFAKLTQEMVVSKEQTAKVYKTNPKLFVDHLLSNDPVLRRSALRSGIGIHDLPKFPKLTRELEQKMVAAVRQAKYTAAEGATGTKEERVQAAKKAIHLLRRYRAPGVTRTLRGLMHEEEMDSEVRDETLRAWTARATEKEIKKEVAHFTQLTSQLQLRPEMTGVALHLASRPEGAKLCATLIASKDTVLAVQASLYLTQQNEVDPTLRRHAAMVLKAHRPDLLDSNVSFGWRDKLEHLFFLFIHSGASPTPTIKKGASSSSS